MTVLQTQATSQWNRHYVHIVPPAGRPRCVCLPVVCRRSMPITGSCFTTPAAGTPPPPKEGPLESAVVSMKFFTGLGCTQVSQTTPTLRFCIIYDHCRQYAFISPLVRNSHAPVQRLRIDDHGGVVLVNGTRQLALRLGETLADGEHAVDDDRVYALLYLALQIHSGQLTEESDGEYGRRGWVRECIPVPCADRCSPNRSSHTPARAA